MQQPIYSNQNTVAEMQWLKYKLVEKQIINFNNCLYYFY